MLCFEKPNIENTELRNEFNTKFDLVTVQYCYLLKKPKRSWYSNIKSLSGQVLEPIEITFPYAVALINVDSITDIIQDSLSIYKCLKTIGGLRETQFKIEGLEESSQLSILMLTPKALFKLLEYFHGVKHSFPKDRTQFLIKY